MPFLLLSSKKKITEKDLNAFSRKIVPILEEHDKNPKLLRVFARFNTTQPSELKVIEMDTFEVFVRAVDEVRAALLPQTETIIGSSFSDTHVYRGRNSVLDFRKLPEADVQSTAPLNHLSAMMVDVVFSQKTAQDKETLAENFAGRFCDVFEEQKALFGYDFAADEVRFFFSVGERPKVRTFFREPKFQKTERGEIERVLMKDVVADFPDLRSAFIGIDGVQRSWFGDQMPHRMA